MQAPPAETFRPHADFWVFGMADLFAPETDEAEASTVSLRTLLRRRYSVADGEWIIMEEVAAKPAGGGFADAVAMNTWRSRGYAVHGFELKISRGDWLRELKNPGKAEPVFRYCDRWYLVSEPNVVKPGELPATWGHLERRGGSLHVATEAPKLQPEVVSREFFASMMRRAHSDLISLADRRHRDALEALRRQHREDTDRRIAEGIARGTGELEALRGQIAKFTEETGLSFERYSGPPAATIKLAQALQKLDRWRDEPLGKLAQLASDCEHAGRILRDAIAETGLREDAEAR